MILKDLDKLVHDLRAFCDDMKKQGIKCGVQIEKNGVVTERFGEQLMEKRPVCPMKIIPIRGGATLSVTGDFKLHCIGDTCMRFPCEVVKVAEVDA